MSDSLKPLEILLAERDTAAPSVPPELVEQIYRIEHRVQFDAQRREAAGRIRQIVEARLSDEVLTGDSYDHATG